MLRTRERKPVSEVTALSLAQVKIESQKGPQPEIGSDLYARALTKLAVGENMNITKV